MKSFWRSIFKRNTSYTAIDIGASEIKLAEVTRQGKDVFISSLGSLKTPEGAFSENPSVELLAEAVKELVEISGVNCKEVITSIGGGLVITRHIRMPKMPVDELEKAVRWEAEKYIPLPVKDLVLRHVVMDEVNVEGNKQLNILLVAAPKELVYSYLDIFARAGLEVSAIDIQSFALWRVFLRNNTDEGAVAVIDLGGQTSRFIISEKGCIRYTRILPFGGMQLTADKDTPRVQERLYGEADLTYSMIAAATDLDEGMPSAQKGLRELVREVKRSLDFYKVQELGNTVEKIIITGGTSKFEGLGAYLATELGLPVELGVPGLPVSKKNGLAEPVDPAFSVAIGLALREVL